MWHGDVTGYSLASNMIAESFTFDLAIKGSLAWQKPVGEILMKT